MRKFSALLVLTAGFTFAQGIYLGPARKIITGTVLPTHCSIGSVFFKSDAAAGSNIYGCTAVDTWTAQAGGGGGATITGTVGEVPIISGASAATGNVAFVANFTALPVPSAPSLTKVGAGTGTTWGYKRVCGMIGGAPLALGSDSSAAATISGNATLDGTHSITITIPTLTAPETSCDVYRTTAGGTPNTTGLIGNAASGMTLSDTGLPIIQPFSYEPSADYSTGIGSSIPFLNNNGDSQFGSMAHASELSERYLNTTAYGLGVYGDNHTQGFKPTFVVNMIGNDDTLPATTAVIDFQSYQTATTGPVVRIRGDLSGTSSNVTGDIEGLEIRLLTRNFSDITGSVVGINNLINQVESADSIEAYYTAPTVIYGAVNSYRSYYASGPTLSGGSLNEFEAFYSTDLAGSSANPYYSWFGSRGAGVCKEDNGFNAVGQSICRVYNPQALQYTPGNPIFERTVYGQFNSNVAEIGTEAGGSGTERNLKLIGQEVHIGQPSNIATTTFVGAGLDDGYYNGRFSSTTATYCAIIDGTGTPDTFKWGTNGACDNGATTVAITGANQALSNGVVIKFAATTGHTATNKWSVVATGATDNANFDSTGILKTAGYKSSDGSAGISCSVPALGATITVKNGLITALTGC